MLKLTRIDIYYGDVKILHEISINVDENEIVALVGANGAGKTTALKAISGLLTPKNGEITFFGERIDNVESHLIVEKGIVQIPEGRMLFPQMTVRENLELGSYNQKAKIKRSESLEKIYSLFPILKERESQLAGTLSGGEQQMLAIARGLMAIPKLLMLDEPSLGLAPNLVKSIFKIVKEINRTGTTILLVEQNVRQSLRISDRGYVLENGRIVIEGGSKHLLENDHVKKSYLGM